MPKHVLGFLIGCIAYTRSVRRKYIIGIILAISLVAGGLYMFLGRSKPAAIQQQSTKQDTEPSYSVSKDITYCSPQGVDQKLDIYTPKNAGDSTPIIIHVHGGSWTSGQKSDYNMLPYLESLVNAGFIVASVNYRLAPTYTFPAQIQDVKCAVRFLRASAKLYHIDTNNIGMIGESAGGHLAALTGTAQNTADFETNELAGVSDKVKAVVDLFGPANLVSYVQDEPIVSGGIKEFLGSYNPVLASPTHYVSATSVPFSIIHGDSDIVVPFSQSQELHDTLLKAGATSTLTKVVNAGHGLTLMRSGDLSPSIEQIQTDAIAFFKKFL